MTSLHTKDNEYMDQIREVYDEIPKSVLAAIAVSALTCGGDRLEEATEAVVKEWVCLHNAGVVAQKPRGRSKEIARNIADS